MQESPQPTAAPTQERPQPTAVPTAEVVQPTAAPTQPTVVPTAPPTTTRMTLDEYVAHCSEEHIVGVSEGEEDLTFGQLLEATEEAIEFLNALEPPIEVAAWHVTLVIFQTDFKILLLEYGTQRDAIPSDEFFLNEYLPLVEKSVARIIRDAKGMSPDTRDRLIAADCLDEEILNLVVAEEVPATPLVLGESVEAVVTEAGEYHSYSFEAEQGVSYRVTMVRETLPDFALAWPYASGRFPRRISSVQTEGDWVEYWEAPAAGTYVVDVAGGAENSTGSYTLTVSVVRRLGIPANVKYAWDGATIVVSWDAVDGADYYKVYYDDFSDDGCQFDSDGILRVCDEIATDVAETTFVHTEPERNNYYWVTACNSEGCSKIDSDNPARYFGWAAHPAAAALVALYDGTDGDNWWSNTYWFSDKPLDQWYGVKTNSDGQVTRLCLAANNLKGEIPIELGALSNLIELDLSFNPLSGTIPAELGSLFRLESLHLRGMGLVGNRDHSDYMFGLDGLDRFESLRDQSDQLSTCWIKRHSRLAKLLTTDASEDTYGRITLLQESLNRSLASHGVAPVQFGPSRERLGLPEEGWREIALSGAIPPALGKLSNLKTLDLSWNYLNGEIPEELSNLAQLERLYLGGNQLTGSLPAGIVGLSELAHLVLTDNELSGEVPAGLGQLTNLSILRLDQNQFSGEIPPALGELAHLEELDLSENMLSGEIPSQLGYLPRLKDLFLYDNRLSGAIPPEFGALASLESLELQSNRLSGPIPSELGDLGNLQVLALNTNQLNGKIPVELGDLGSLQVLLLHENELEGDIPLELGNLTQLYVLALHDNQLTGGPLEALLADLENLAAVTVCELNHFSCDIVGLVGEAVRVGVDAVFGPNGVLGHVLGGFGIAVGAFLGGLGSFFGF